MKLKHNLKGQTFGKWKVLRRAFSNKMNRTEWLCRCLCGIERIVHSGDLVSGHSKGCRSCAVKERGPITHGLYGSKRYDLYHSARNRAKRDGIPFTLVPKDVPEIPSVCPLLGIPIVQDNKLCGPNSPTLDRILPAAGYIASNVWIISHRANTIKSDASVDELIVLAKNLADRRIKEINSLIEKEKYAIIGVEVKKK